MPYRDKIVERAILIATDEATPKSDINTAVCLVLKKSSEAYAKFKDKLPVTAHLLSKSITPNWIMAEALWAEFSQADLRHAVACVLWQAHNELWGEVQLGVEMAWTANGGRL